MKDSFQRRAVRLLLCFAVLWGIAHASGCDMGTYEKRFQEQRSDWR